MRARHLRSLLVALGLLQSSIALGQSPPVEQLVTQIQDALLIVSRTLSREALPALHEAEISLQTTIARKGEAGFEFLVITAGGEVSDEEVQSVVLTLRPPSPGTEQKSAASDFATALANAIVAAARGVRPALQREPKLGLARLEAMISFAVKREGELGVKFTFLPVTAKLGGGMTKNQLHKVRLVYGQAQ